MSEENLLLLEFREILRKALEAEGIEVTGTGFGMGPCAGQADVDIRINGRDLYLHLWMSAHIDEEDERRLRDEADGLVDVPTDPINSDDILAELPPERRSEVLEGGRQLIAEERAALKTFDAAKYLDSPVAIAAYLKEAFETGEDDLIAQALDTVARARQRAR
jgi:hypothetical protein